MTVITITNASVPLLCVLSSEEEEEPAQSAATLAALERQKLLAEVAERKRKILRDVEVSHVPGRVTMAETSRILINPRRMCKGYSSQLC